MEKKEKQLKFCTSGVLLIVYGVLSILLRSYLDWSYILLQIPYIALGIVLLIKNKYLNVVFWTLTGVTRIVWIIRNVVYLYEFSAVRYDIIFNILDMVVVVLLIISSIKVGQQTTFWKPAKLVVLGVGIIQVIPSFWSFLILRSIHGMLLLFLCVIYYMSTYLFIVWAERPYENDDEQFYHEKLGVAHRDMIPHVLLLIFTLGIYWLYWIYKTTEYTNIIKPNEDRSAAAQLLLCMLIPFYSIYWVYKTTEIIDETAKNIGVASDLTVLCTILAIFIQFVPPIIMQDKINKIATSSTKPKPGYIHEEG